MIDIVGGDKGRSSLRQDEVEIGQGIGGASQPHRRRATEGVQIGVVGIGTQSRRVVGQGLFVIALVEVRIGAIADDLGVTGLQLDGLAVVDDGTIVVLLGVKGIAALDVEVGVIRSQLDGLVEVGDREIVLVGFDVTHRAVEKHQGTVRWQKRLSCRQDAGAGLDDLGAVRRFRAGLHEGIDLGIRGGRRSRRLRPGRRL